MPVIFPVFPSLLKFIMPEEQYIFMSPNVAIPPPLRTGLAENSAYSPALTVILSFDNSILLGREAVIVVYPLTASLLPFKYLVRIK